MIVPILMKTRRQQFFLLAVMSLICVLILAIRMFRTQSGMYFFLNWNLFLAIIPLLFTSMLYFHRPIFKSSGFKFSVLLAWLLFFPNAPYILTDLFHIRHVTNVPIWFDLILILGYAWTGLIAGFVSLRDIEIKLFGNWKTWQSSLTVSMLLFITGFGIYLGRFLRFNSWDVVKKPYILVQDVADRFIDPLDHPRTWGVTIGMGLLLNLMYWSLRIFSQRNDLSTSKSTKVKLLKMN